MEVLCGEGQVTHQKERSIPLLSVAGPRQQLRGFISLGTSLRLPVGLRVRGPFRYEANAVRV